MSDAAYERLSPEDVGLPPGARMPVRFTPAQQWSPLVISFPHVGLAWPHDLRPKPQADFPRNADYDVHTLYALAPHVGAASVAAVYSRLVVDLNRADDDISRRVVPDHPAPRPRTNPGIVPQDDDPDAERESGRPGRGVVWSTALGDVRLFRGPLSYARFRDRIERFHTPYYRALEVLLQRRRERFGFAILLDAHSMPGSVGPDLVLGTLAGESCDPELQRHALEALSDPDRAEPLHVTLNEPYRGGEVVRRFGRPQQGTHALQLEVSRSVYMDERRYRLYDAPEPEAGTFPAGGRELSDGSGSLRPVLGAGPHRPTVPAGPRRGRRLVELRHRVNSLVVRLASHRAPPGPGATGAPPHAMP